MTFRLTTIVLLGLTMTGIAASNAGALTITLAPSEDTFTSFFDGDTNFGSLPGMNTSIAFLSPRQFSYLKFDLTSIPSDQVIVEATLSLYQVGQGGAAGGGPAVAWHFVDSWGESALTWNNAPPLTGPRLASNADTGTGWVEWDLFELGAWDVAADRSDGILSILLGEGLSGDSAHSFCSRESDPALDNCLVPGELQTDEDRDPFLTLVVIPEPSTSLLLGLGLVGLSRRRRARA